MNGESSESEDNNTVDILVKTVTELSRAVKKMEVDNRLQKGQEGPSKQQEEMDVIPSHMGFKIYVTGLEGVRCRKFGDSTFF